MSLPLSTRDFLDLSNYCLQLVVRLRGLRNDHTHLEAEAGFLLILFNELHHTLREFCNIPTDYAKILSGIRQNCYETLHHLEAHLWRYEKSRTDNVIKKHGRRFMMAVKNRTPELKAELLRQVVLMSQMLSLLRQQLECFKAEQFRSTMLSKVEALTKALRLSSLEAKHDKLFLAQAVNSIRQAQLRGPSFNPLLNANSLIHLPLVFDDPRVKALTMGDEAPIKSVTDPPKQKADSHRVTPWLLVVVGILAIAVAMFYVGK